MVGIADLMGVADEAAPPDGATHLGVPDIAGRIERLHRALAAGGDRLDPAAIDNAAAVIERTTERLRLGALDTVVALVGATGSGKSSLFNALAGLEIAEVGVVRPTTGQPTACVWGAEGADGLLDWLEVPRRHRTERESVLDADRQAPLHGLILLDVPDHDSTFVTHRLEVDRLVTLVDLLVWVVDPQKYADEVLHTGYLRRMAGHGAVMVVVLNQIDRLSAAEAETCRRDLRRLLDADGLPAVRLLATSAVRGDGIAELRDVLAGLVQEHTAVFERAASDLDGAAAWLADGVAPYEPDPRDLPGSQEFVGALAAAAGLPVIVDAVGTDYIRQASRRVGWAFVRWWRLLRPDSMRRLRLGDAEEELRELIRTTLPASAPSQHSRVELAARAMTEATAADLPGRWAAAVRSVGSRSVMSASSMAAAQPIALPDALDEAVHGVDLTLRGPLWWWVLDGVQALAALVAVFGLFWLVIVETTGWFALARLNPPGVGSWSAPSLMLVLGLGLGLVLAGAGWWAVQLGARRRRALVAAQLRDAVQVVAWAQVISPISEVLVDHRVARESLTGT